MVIVCGSIGALIVSVIRYVGVVPAHGSFLAFYTNFLPIPLVLLTEKDGSQNVHIAPEAFDVATAEFPDQIDVWQNALPFGLKGNLKAVCIFHCYESVNSKHHHS